MLLLKCFDIICIGLMFRWNFPIPVCQRGCPTLVPLHNGTVYPEQCTLQKYGDNSLSVVAEGVTCDFSCDDGYILNGVSQRSCKAGGLWDGDEVSY